MKALKIIFLLFIFHIACCLSTYAQWAQLNSGTTNFLNEVHFPATDTGYVVGGLGTILKTTDGGTNWIALNSGTIASLRDVYFANTFTGFAVGDSGIILKTNDGGINWTKYIYNSAMSAFSTVQFINSNVGFAAGYQYPPISPVILKTTDGGLNWTNAIINGGVQNVVSSMHFPVPDTGYAFLYGQAIKTVDGGNTWNSITMTSALGIDLEACFFTDAATGYVGGWYYVPRLGKTVDGCISWTVKPDSIYGITSIYFPDNSIGYATISGGIIKTTDAGNNWNKITDTSFTYNVRSLYFTDISTGYAVGGNGTIIKTINGGGLSQGAECSCYTVQGLNITGTDSMELTLINSCSNNVYLNLYVISTISPFDTLGRQEINNAAILPWNTNVSNILHTNLISIPPFGTYRVSITNGTLNCDSIQFSTAMNISDIQNNNIISFTPNPASDFISFENKNPDAKKITVRIFDAAGKLVLEKVISKENNFIIPLINVETGIYIVTVSDDKKISREKIIVQH